MGTQAGTIDRRAKNFEKKFSKKITGAKTFFRKNQGAKTFSQNPAYVPPKWI